MFTFLFPFNPKCGGRPLIILVKNTCYKHVSESLEEYLTVSVCNLLISNTLKKFFFVKVYFN